MATPAAWASACEKFRASLSLSQVESQKDPENDPYKSKYRARELLQEVKALLGPAADEDEDEEAGGGGGGGGGPGADEGPEAERAGLGAGVEPSARAVRLAAVELQLGLNHIDTEELAAGEEHLQNCLRLVRRSRLEPAAVSLHLQAQNNLGILWSERDEIETAQSYLESAEALYNQYMKEIGNPPLDPNEHFLAEEEKLTEQERSRRFEKAYTHTLYYLAQVYQHLEMIEKAAQYCHTTLKRQLEYSGYHPVEWAINAATLSQYYINKQCFMESRHCLSAASVVFSQAEQTASTEDSESETEQDQQDLRQRKAEIARCWIKYCLNLLQNAQASLEDNIGELDLDKQSELKAQRKREEDEKENGRKKVVLFGTSDVCDAILAMEEKVACVPPLDFREAREVFLVGQNYVFEAKEYFQVDGYITDHIEIVQDHSSLFKVLAFFEEDYERRCKMHKRRIDMLEPLTVDLNPQYYLLINRQLQFELAHTYYEMMDLKVAIANRLEELDSHTIKKINSLAQSAIKYYELFLDSLKDPNKVFPEQLGEDVLRPALVAKFHIARLYGKLITSDGRKELDNMQASLEYYTFLVDYCERYPEAVHAVETELELSKEMAGLLPAKMERLRAKLSPFT
ncbi:KIF-binding protein isoform X1 [Trichosurus vulpecula]|uniref:KIF-binding protein isoform X1 n=1 Tax=Trichosurus vulpecula TaxID=9337 RepID=UPI00186B2FE1|nr:KIF-binding protein isoform X1 [Trichosurus vulpecula]